MRQLINRVKYHINKLIMDFNRPRIMEDFNKIHALPLASIEAFKRLLFLVFDNRNGFNCALSREDQTLAQKNIFLTYGEILPEGLERLFYYIKPTAQDSFVDLGSGAGKAVLQSYLCTDIAASYGVEIDSARYDLSQKVLTELQQNVPNFFNNNKNKTIAFENQNITDFDFNKITLVFCNATCFGPNLMGIIAEKINSHPNIRAAMSSQKIEGLVNLTTEHIIEVEVSWHVPPAKSNIYVYTKL